MRTKQYTQKEYELIINKSSEKQTLALIQESGYEVSDNRLLEHLLAGKLLNTFRR